MHFPRQLGPYRLLRKLGQGGMAEVFLALAFGASGFERRIVIKRLLPELQGDARFERMFIEEARLQARLSHRNIVQVHELSMLEGSYCVRMDYVDGASLASLLARARPSVGLSLLIADELALALDYVHRAADESSRPLGLVHRDVSPSNVLTSLEGEVKLADFGIAKATLLKEITHAGVRKGKYAYMSPEQVTGEPLSARSDQFALGVLLAELLTGARPFDGETPLETMDRIREAASPPLDGVDPEIGRIVRQCLARSPEERFPSMEALRQALAERRRQLPPAEAPDLARWAREALRSP